VLVLAACFHPSLSISLPLFENRGRRECRVRAAPAVSCAKDCAFGAHEHTGERRTLRHPLRNGFTAYFVLSPVERACCHRHQREIFRQLGASIRGARTTRLDRTQQNHSPLKRCVHRIPRPTCRDDGDTPLMWARDGGTHASDLPDMTSRIFLCEGLDTISENQK
jgi:hypothetical protein